MMILQCENYPNEVLIKAFILFHKMVLKREGKKFCVAASRYIFTFNIQGSQEQSKKLCEIHREKKPKKTINVKKNYLTGSIDKALNFKALRPMYQGTLHLGVK